MAVTFYDQKFETTSQPADPEGHYWLFHQSASPSNLWGGQLIVVWGLFLTFKSCWSSKWASHRSDVVMWSWDGKGLEGIAKCNRHTAGWRGVMVDGRMSLSIFPAEIWGCGPVRKDSVCTHSKYISVSLWSLMLKWWKHCCDTWRNVYETCVCIDVHIHTDSVRTFKCFSFIPQGPYVHFFSKHARGTTVPGLATMETSI